MNTTRHFEALALLLVAPFFAQTVAPPPTAPAKPAADEATITLNPYVVDASSDKGWVASQSIAGSRLNTDLKDFAASIEVITMEFFEGRVFVFSAGCEF